MDRIRQWTRAVCALLLALVLLSCTAADLYPPALPDATIAWEQTPLVPAIRIPHELLVFDVRATEDLPQEMPPPEEWQYFTPALPTKQTCFGKGKKRSCKEVPIPTIEAANEQALIRPTQAMMRNGAKVRYKLLPDRTYQILTSPISATFIYLPPGESMTVPPPIQNDAKKPKAWVIGWAVQREDSEDRREVLMVRPVGPLPGEPFEPYETTTGLVLRSGITIFCHLVATETTSMVSVTWDLPEGKKAPEVPIDLRPPKIDLTRLHTAYRLEPQGKVTPPWMPVAVFDDGSRTFIKFREALTYTRAPSAYGLTTTGMMALVQSHMFVRPQQPEQGAVLVVQGLWPALELKDTTGLRLTIVRQDTTAKAMKDVSYAPPPVAPARRVRPPEQRHPRQQPDRDDQFVRGE